jgi:hypothetical protein
VGGSEHVHRLVLRDRSVELRFDPFARSISIRGQVLPLGESNVVLIDNADVPDGMYVVATIRAIGAKSQSGESLDPVSAIVSSSGQLFEFLRCDATTLANPVDPGTKLMVARCAKMRPQ